MPSSGRTHSSSSHSYVSWQDAWLAYLDIKMFPTKTSRDEEMVNCVSDATGSCMEKTTGEKILEQGGVYRDIVLTRSTFAGFKSHFGNTFTIPKSGNILMQLSLMHQSAFMPSNFNDI